LQESPEAHAHIAPLLTQCAELGGSTAKLVSRLAAGEARAAESEPTLGELRGRIEAIPGAGPSNGSVGQVSVSLRPLSTDEEDQVDEALAPGRQKTEVLVEFMNVPVSRYDMATLRPGCWLNDEVINLFFKLLEGREAKATAAKAAGKTDDPFIQAPRCHFCQTNFYTKLVGGGYDYKQVRRWTKKVDVFTKELIIVPYHCHGNHWTLAVINFKLKRFEYYDSLFGHEGSILQDLRKWLCDESLDKKKVAFDTSDWTDLAFKSQSGNPRQQNGHDCGVFMARTADYLSRNGLLDFSQANMPYFRRRMVLEILTTTLL